MADHAHQRILEAVQAVLIAASTAAGARVYLDRVDELPAANLPAIDILGADDTGEDAIVYSTGSSYAANMEKAMTEAMKRGGYYIPGRNDLPPQHWRDLTYYDRMPSQWN